MILIIYSILFIWIYMSAWFVIAVWRRDNGLADVAWGFGFALLSLLPWLLKAEAPAGPYVGLIVMVWIWALRLSGHIAVRNRRKGTEDFRYRQWRQDWGKQWLWRSYLQVFMLQGFFMWVISLPLQIAALAENPGWSAWCWLGLVVFAFGWAWESIADYQLLRFKNNTNQQGKIMKSGLWQFSRHPNYFGECVLWWGIWLYSLSFEDAYWGIIGPLILTWLLLRVSGVPMLEAKYKDDPEYQEYIRHTSAFVPGRPGKA